MATAHKCAKCGRLTIFPVWTTADGSKRRKRPICEDCHREAVRGLGRGRTGAAVDRWLEPAQREPGAAYNKYNGLPAQDPR